MISTEILYENKNKTEFFGKYQDIRQKMDYNYFKNYTKERQLFQDTIIDSYFVNIKSRNNCWIMFTCGCFGSGKSHVIDYFNNLGFVNRNEYIYIDPDQIKHKLPETKTYINNNPVHASTMLHMESTFISLLIEYIALHNSYPIIIDGSLHNHKWYQEHFKYI